MQQSKDKRSQIMRAVKGKNTAPELLVRKIIFSLGYRYRLHASHLPGTPDIYFTKKQKAIFIHGCFWHGHTCKRGNRIPSTNKDYWITKIENNIKRDERAITLLSEKGWSVLVVWECGLKDLTHLSNSLRTFMQS